MFVSSQDISMGQEQPQTKANSMMVGKRQTAKEPSELGLSDQLNQIGSDQRRGSGSSRRRRASLKSLQVAESLRQTELEEVLSPRRLANKRNPFQFSDDPHLALTKMDTDIASQKIIPYQRAPYVQTLSNPSYPEEIITVQYCKVVPQHLNKELDFESDLQLSRCTNKGGRCGGVMIAVDHQREVVHCAVCHTKNMPKYFKCSTCEKNVTCPKCNLTNFKNAMLKSKVSKYFETENYKMFPAERKESVKTDIDGNPIRPGATTSTSNADTFKTQSTHIAASPDLEVSGALSASGNMLNASGNGLGDEAAFEPGFTEKTEEIKHQVEMDSIQKEKNFRKLYDQTKQKDEKGIQITEFATLQKQKLYSEVQKDTSYALVSFWRYEMSTFICYKVSRIDNPLFSEPKYDLNFRTFLHLSDDNRLFYFAEASAKMMALYFLETQQDDLSAYSKMEDPAQQWKTTIEHVEHTNLGEGQLLNKDKDVQMLFKIIFDTHLQPDATEIVHCNVMPKVITHSGKKYLVLKAKWAKKHKNIAGTQDDVAKEWLPTKQDNLFFVSLEHDRIEFTIYNSDMFVGLVEDSVYFLRKRNIVEMKWGTHATEVQLNASQALSHVSNKLRSYVKCVQESTNVYPCNCWYFEQDFLQKNEEFGADLDDALKKATLLEARLHKKQNRVSIIYQGVGLFTYELWERLPWSQSTKWSGTVGDHILTFDMCISQTSNNEIPEQITVQNFINQRNPGVVMKMNSQIGHLTQRNLGSQEFDCKVQLWISETDKYTFEGVLNKQTATFKGAIENQGDFSALFVDSNPNLYNKAEFSFKGLDHADQAYMYFSYETQRDVVFCQPAPNGHQYACGDMKVKMKNKEPGYSNFRLELYDLDREVEHHGLNRVKNLDEKIKLECLLPDSFQETKDIHGLMKLPSLMMAPIRLMWDSQALETKKDIEKSIKFQTQMFYEYRTTLKTNTLFLQGRSTKAMNDKSHKLLFPLWTSLPSEERSVSYPLLCYKSVSPMDNELVICNLAQNEPLKIVNIYPYRFIQFIEMGMNSERLHSNAKGSSNGSGKTSTADKNTTIYFLVGITIRDKDKINTRTVMRVMCYQHFPYKLSFSNFRQKEGFLRNPNISILSGEIDINNNDLKHNEKMYDALQAYNYDVNRFSKEKVRSATLIQREVAEGIAMLLVMQLTDGVFTFNMNNGDIWCSKTEYPDCRMLKFVMQRTPFEEIYYAERNLDSGCDQIVKLHYQGGDTPTKSVAIKMMGEELLVLTVKVEGSVDQSQTKKHALYLIDSDLLFEKYVCADSETDPVVVFSVDLTKLEGIHSVLLHLQNSEWHNTLTLHERGIRAIEEKNKRLTSTTISFNGAFSQTQEFLGFDERKNKSKVKFGEATNQDKVLSVWGIPWMNASMTELEEGDFNYFLVENEVFSRRIELMRQDQQLQLSGDSKIVMIGNSYIAVKVQEAKQYLLFTQKHLQCVQPLCYEELEPATNVTNNIQYFYAKKMGKNRILSTYLIKFTGVRQEILLDLTKVSEQLLKTLKLKLSQDAVVSDDDSRSDQDDRKDKIKLNQANDNSEDSGVDEMIDIVKGGGLMIIENLEIRKQELISFDSYQLLSKHQRQQNAVCSSEITFFHTLKLKDDCKRPYRDPKLKLFMGFKLDLEVDKNTGRQASLVAFDFMDNLDRHELNNLKFFYTSYYLVISTNRNIYWVNREDLTNLSSQDSFDAKFQQMPFEEFQSSVKEFGFQAFCASPFNINIAEKGEYRPNVIQVSFASLSILWCLDENKEVVFAERVDQFENYHNFTQTGMLPHSYKPEAEGKSMAKAVFVQENEKGTLMLSLPSRQLLTGCLFRNFSMIELYEVLSALKSIKMNLFVPKIDLQTSLANFNGKSFWEVFMERADFLKMIETQITEQDLQSKKSVDEAGKETDNILIRRLYWSLQAPTHQLYNNKYGVLGSLQFDPAKVGKKFVFGSIHKSGESDVDDVSDLEEALLAKVKIARDRYTQTCKIDRSFPRRLLHRIYSTLFPKEHTKRQKRAERGTIAQFRNPAKNIIQHVLEQDKLSHLLDPFLRLLMLSGEVRLSNLASQLNQLKLTLKLGSTQIQEFREVSMFQTEITKDVEVCHWLPDDDMITFQSNHSLMGKDQIAKCVEATQTRRLRKRQEQLRHTFTCTSTKELRNFRNQWKKPLEERKITHVQVKILEIECLSKRDQFVQFYKFLQGLDSDSIYKNSVIRTILSKQSISLRVYLVFGLFLTLMLSSMVYFGDYLFRPPTDSYSSGEAGKVRVVINCVSVLLAFVEWNNLIMSDSKPIEDRLTNLNQFCTLVLTNYVVIKHGLQNNDQESISNLAQIASVTMVLQWILLITWMRLSKRLSFYVTMIGRTVSDLMLFLIMFIVCIMMFANAIYILNKSMFYTVPIAGELAAAGARMMEEAAAQSEEIAPLAAVAFGDEGLDAILDQYRVGLGDFNTDPYGSSNSNLIWIYFVVATFFTQITFLNMLIAIMSETFSKVTDARAEITLRSKTMLYIDYHWLNEFLVHSKLTLEKRYLYVITPISGQEADESASELLLETLDTANSQVKLNDRNIKKIEQTSFKIANDVSDLQKQLIQVQERFSEQDKSLKAILEVLINNQAAAQKVAQITGKLQRIVKPSVKVEEVERPTEEAGLQKSSPLKKQMKRVTISTPAPVDTENPVSPKNEPTMQNLVSDTTTQKVSSFEAEDTLKVPQSKMTPQFLLLNKITNKKSKKLSYDKGKLLPNLHKSPPREELKIFEDTPEKELEDGSAQVIQPLRNSQNIHREEQDDDWE